MPTDPFLLPPLSGTPRPTGKCPSPLTHLLNEIDARLQIESKVDEGPVDTLYLVLLLFQDKHGVVEQLLQLLVSIVDAQLLKGVELRGGKNHIKKKKNHISQQSTWMMRAAGPAHIAIWYVGGLRCV